MKKFLMGIIAFTLIVMPACSGLGKSASASAGDCAICTAEKRATCDKTDCAAKQAVAQCCADANALGKDCKGCNK